MTDPIMATLQVTKDSKRISNYYPITSDELKPLTGYTAEGSPGNL